MANWSEGRARRTTRLGCAYTALPQGTRLGMEQGGEYSAVMESTLWAAGLAEGHVGG